MVIFSDFRMVEGQPLQYKNSAHFVDMLTNVHKTSNVLDQSENITFASLNTKNDVENLKLPIKLKKQKPASNRNIKCGWRSCGVYFTCIYQLSTHISNDHTFSSPEGVFYCDWEGCSRNRRGFNARYKMLVHVRTHTNEKPHQCDQCSKAFSRAENLKIHLRSHTGEKPYVCHIPGCRKAYSNSSDRFKHTRTHQIQKPYQCKISGCLKKYTDPSSLRKHVKTYKHLLSTEKDLPETQRISIYENSNNQLSHYCNYEENNNYKISKLDSNLKEYKTYNFHITSKNVLHLPCDILHDKIFVDLPLDLRIHRT